MNLKELPGTPEKLLHELMQSAQLFDDVSCMVLWDGKHLFVCDKPPVPPYRISIPDEFGNPLISPITKAEALEYLEGFFK